MARYFGSGPHESLAHWIGWRIGAGVASVGREVDYLTQRAKTSSERERSAWLFRCAVSCALVISEYLFLYVFLPGATIWLPWGVPGSSCCYSPGQCPGFRSSRDAALRS